MVYNHIFKNIDALVDFLRKEGWTMDKRYYGNAPYEVIDYGNNRFVYYPQPKFSPIFRGQNAFYEPCIANKYRGNPDNLQLFIEDLRVEEYRQVTSKHPYIKKEIEAGIYYDYKALAQHYEFKTSMLDLTNSLPVAAFFAVTYKQGNSFYPMKKQDNAGVLYFIPKDTVVNSLKTAPKLLPVGWQVFRRPGEQRAFTIKLPNYEDFHNIPPVFAFKFYYDQKVSERILNVFKGGATLFPYDPFAEKAARIKDGKVFSKQSFENVYKSYKAKFSKEELLNKLKNQNININHDSGWDYTSDEINQISEMIESDEISRGRVATTRLFYKPGKK